MDLTAREQPVSLSVTPLRSVSPRIKLVRRYKPIMPPLATLYPFSSPLFLSFLSPLTFGASLLIDTP